jgi:biotin carboxylase
VARVLLVAPATSYRVSDFLAAARRLQLGVTVACDRPLPLAAVAAEGLLAICLRPLNEGVAQILEHAREWRPDAVVGTDDETVELAARAAQALGCRHAAPAAVRDARDKHRFRQRLLAAGLRCPPFRLVDLGGDGCGGARDALAREARMLRYPVVLKPLHLGASRGVLRADDAAAFLAACARIAPIILASAGRLPRRLSRHVLVEGFLPGAEVALDGLLEGGRLQLLSLFDKPEPMNGPCFEETLFVAPSRQPPAVQADIQQQVLAAARALGLHSGPVHAELRVHRGEATLLELAPRTIGGLCARSLRFAAGASEEELILRQALGRPTHNLAPEGGPHGVMMIPVPGDGVLRAVHGVERARAVAGIEDVTITVTPGQRLRRLPEGGGPYPGFLFARAPTRAAVEQALRAAHAVLHFDLHPPG